MFELGFLGTKAAFYMDIVTLYFAILPFLLLFSIYFAVKKEIKKHYTSQIIIYIMTIIMVLLFEIGVRFDGGYVKFLELSNVNETFMNIYLVVHIIIALLSVIAWSILLMSSYKSFKAHSLENKKHKKRAKIITLGLIITSFMGVNIYYLLFIY
jgi:putative membrane protein